MSEIIFDKIAAVITAKKGVNIELIKFESSFEELGLDSLDAVELIADLEEEFNVTIPNIDLQNIKSVKQAISSLEKAMQ